MTPTSFWLLIIGALLIPVIWAIATANRFVRLDQHIRESWANIDVLLKRRYDLIPNLVETVKGYAKHEREVLERVLAARERAVRSVGPAKQQADDENELVHSVNQLLARAEAYPELKASSNYVALQHELVNTEDRIAAARRFYNANVRDNNALIDQFPSMIIASLMSRKPVDYFEIDELAVRALPQVSFAT